ncbi:hypothetical protein NBRC116583_05230 [Arenicella sp. 4NH20-0111]|uniref:membrane protein insertion efficiency factor YidD n=1 Tax=Arenicella sp. 4NH20-0111 TaxID=3127648 RepID=UPI0031081B4D
MLKKLFNAVFWVYKLVISPLLGTNCRFAPTCSEYTRDALELHGAFKGSCLAIKRVCRCHPWGGHGFDPVPDVVRQNIDDLGNPNHSKRNKTKD